MPQQLVAIDIVTTNRDPLEAEIVEFEAVAITGKSIGERFHTLARPPEPLSLRAECDRDGAGWSGGENALRSGEDEEALSASRAPLVEMAGIEPASERFDRRTSTSVVDLLGLAARPPADRVSG